MTSARPPAAPAVPPEGVLRWSPRRRRAGPPAARHVPTRAWAARRCRLPRCARSGAGRDLAPQAGVARGGLPRARDRPAARLPPRPAAEGWAGAPTGWRATAPRRRLDAGPGVSLAWRERSLSSEVRLCPVGRSNGASSSACPSVRSKRGPGVARWNSVSVSISRAIGGSGPCSSGAAFSAGRPAACRVSSVPPLISPPMSRDANRAAWSGKRLATSSAVRCKAANRRWSEAVVPTPCRGRAGADLPDGVMGRGALETSGSRPAPGAGWRAGRASAVQGVSPRRAGSKRLSARAPMERSASSIVGSAATRSAKSSLRCHFGHGYIWAPVSALSGEAVMNQGDLLN